MRRVAEMATFGAQPWEEARRHTPATHAQEPEAAKSPVCRARLSNTPVLEGGQRPAWLRWLSTATTTRYLTSCTCVRPAGESTLSAPSVRPSVRRSPPTRQLSYSHVQLCTSWPLPGDSGYHPWMITRSMRNNQPIHVLGQSKPYVCVDILVSQKYLRSKNDESDSLFKKHPLSKLRNICHYYTWNTVTTVIKKLSFNKHILSDASHYWHIVGNTPGQTEFFFWGGKYLRFSLHTLLPTTI